LLEYIVFLTDFYRMKYFDNDVEC